MKTCPSCGAVCNDNEKFCGNCGYSFLEGGAAPSPAQPAAPVYPDYAQTYAQTFTQPVSGTPKAASKKEFMKLPENKKIHSELKGAAIITFICAGVTLLMGIVGGSWGVMLDVAIMVGLGLGILLSYSRACAVVLLAYGILNMVLGLIQNGVPSGYLIVVAGVLAVIYAFKAEKLWKQYQQNP